jgi:DNA-binding NarL/FixJ family response regulator
LPPACILVGIGLSGRQYLQGKQGCKAMREPAVCEFRGAVLIADDHQVFRIGLAQLLRRHLKVKRFLEAGCFAEAMEHLQNSDLTLAIVDLRMPGLAGPKGIAQMRLLRPEAQIVVLSASDCREDILGALAAGVHGYIVKSQHTDQLIDRLRYVLSGEIYVPPILAERGPDATANPEVTRAAPMQSLSARQRQVLKGLIEGKSNKEIAQALNVAEGTVKMHLAALFRVLGATNRAHAVAVGKQLID